MNKNTNRARQAEKTKKKIFKVGIDLLRTHGFDDVNISDIVKKAGISVGTFYHYYDSKIDLFMELYRNSDELFQGEVREKTEGKSRNDAIIIFFDEYAKLVENDGLPIVKKIFIPENHLFISQNRGMHELLLEITESKEKSEELFLIARGVVFDWALHEGSYDLNVKMERMISQYLK